MIVEKLYAETNERVRFRLKRFNGDWKVVEMRRLNRNAPETKYGTPVVPVKRNNR